MSAIFEKRVRPIPTRVVDESGHKLRRASPPRCMRQSSASTASELTTACCGRRCPRDSCRCRAPRQSCHSCGCRAPSSYVWVDDSGRQRYVREASRGTRSCLCCFPLGFEGHGGGGEFFGGVQVAHVWNRSGTAPQGVLELGWRHGSLMVSKSSGPPTGTLEFSSAKVHERVEDERRLWKRNSNCARVAMRVAVAGAKRKSLGQQLLAHPPTESLHWICGGKHDEGPVRASVRRGRGNGTWRGRSPRCRWGWVSFDDFWI